MNKIIKIEAQIPKDNGKMVKISKIMVNMNHESSK